VRVKSWILAVLACGLAAVFALLGQWQLRRADEAERQAAEFATLADAAALTTLPAADAVGEFRYRRVALRGRYLPQTQVLVDNMTHGGVAGYHVLTPFVATGGGIAVVNRGFVAALPSRSDLPEVAVAAAERTVHGRIDTWLTPALRLDAADLGGAGAVRVMSFPDAKDLERTFGYPVPAYQILLDAGEPDGFVRAWEPSGSRAERNLVYAGQWFALGVATFVAALGWLFKSHFRKRSGA
jgi:surfeit locus 1 family protein